MLFRQKKKEDTNTYDKIITHPEMEKPYFYDCIRFENKFYAGTVKDNLAKLYDDPFNPKKTKIVVKVKNKRLSKIEDGGDTEVLDIDGVIIEKSA
jgi:hypothetical protein